MIFKREVERVHKTASGISRSITFFIFIFKLYKISEKYTDCRPFYQQQLSAVTRSFGQAKTFRRSSCQLLLGHLARSY